MTDSKHVAAFVQRHLKSPEKIVAWGEGYIGEMMGAGKDTQHNGVLLVTESRMIFYRKGLLGEVLESMPLKSVTSIERRSTFGHFTIRIHTSHDSLSFKTFQHVQEQELVNAIEVGRNNDSRAGADPRESPLDMLKTLAELRDAGIISEAEFEAKKSDLLTRL